MKYAILIDGGFAKAKLGSRINPITANDIIQLVEKIRDKDFLKGEYLHRIYFYDSPPYSRAKNKPLKTNL